MITTPLPTTLPFEIEHHCLELRYASLRIHSLKAKQRLLLSIHEHGLRVPIIVIPAEQTARFIVIDGYLRLSVLSELKQDCVAACVWSMTAGDALIYSYSQNSRARTWDPIEEAALLQELVTNHHYTQEQLAHCLARSNTWVCHRLQLINALPGYVKEAIYQGFLTSWSANRVMVPFARANESHAKELVQYLGLHPRSTRELRDFYEHYLRSNRKVRDQMASQPDLFFKSHALSSATVNLLPEEQFDKKLRQTTHLLQAMKSLLPAVFYRQQPIAERRDLEKKWMRVDRILTEFKQTIQELTDDSTPHARDPANAERAGEKHS